MKHARFVVVAATVAGLAGCAQPFYDPQVRVLPPDDQGAPHLPPGPATADHVTPKPLPLAGVFVQMPSAKVISGVEDVVVHARRAENDDGSGKDLGLGFTALVSTPDPDPKNRPAPNRRRPYQVGLKTSEVKVAMPIGLGVYRGLRPRLTTAVLSGGAEGSTIIVWATPREQWMYLAQYTDTGSGTLGYVNLLAADGAVLDSQKFTTTERLIVAEKDATTEQWILRPATPLTNDKIREMCEEAWKRAQEAKVIPQNEDFPG